MSELLSAVGRTDPAPSPDGTRLAWISDRDGRPRAFVAPLPDDGSSVREPAQPLDVRVSGATEPDVTALAWSPDGRWLACQIAPSGGERTRVVLADPDSDDRREIAPSAAAVTFGAWSPTGRTLGVTVQQEGRGESAACLVDVRDGSSTVLATGISAVVCAVGGDGRRAVVRTGPRGRRRLELVDLQHGHRTELVSDATVAGARFGGTVHTVLLHTDAGREHPALLAATLRGDGRMGTVRVVAERPGSDLDLVAVDRSGTRVALVWNDAGRSCPEVADLDGDGHPSPVPAPTTVVTSVSFDRGGSALVVAGHGPGVAPRADRVALGSHAVTPLLDGATGPAVDPRREPFTAEDGLDLHGWLLRAPDVDGPGPALVWLHGGPESEERPGFAPLLQWLAASGTTVFAPNVRGSSGRGRTFTRADDGDRREHSFTDVRAAATHLVRTGVADPDRIAVGGRSYGGYLTLAALTRFPGVFRAGIDVCGMADLQTFYSGTEPWIAAAATPEYGDPDTDAALLRSLSPIHTADRIAVPLLVVHGAHDTNVPVGEAHRIVAALRARDVPVEMMLLDDEGHAVADRHTRERFVRDTGRWLTAALGVRSG